MVAREFAVAEELLLHASKAHLSVERWGLAGNFRVDTFGAWGGKRGAGVAHEVLVSAAMAPVFGLSSGHGVGVCGDDRKLRGVVKEEEGVL